MFQVCKLSLFDKYAEDSVMYMYMYVGYIMYIAYRVKAYLFAPPALPPLSHSA